jgi:hypothetical protein
MWATALIQAVGLAYQAATATGVSATLGATEAGGLLQSPVPTRGGVHCTTTTTMFSETTHIDSAAFLRVASGIKNFKL